MTTKLVFSDNKPVICRLQGRIFVPIDIKDVDATKERAAGYMYTLFVINDHHQQIDDHDKFMRENYSELRRARYGDVEDQLDMMFHGTWTDHVEKVKNEFPKP